MRFSLRKEFFGAIAYDSLNKDYFYLDHLALRLLSSPLPLSDAEHIAHQTNAAEISEVLSQLSHAGLIDNITILPNTPNEEHLSAPLRVFFDFTYQCTERCVHCYTDSGKKGPAELSLNEKLSIIDQLRDMGTFRISLAGGEPLIDKDFFPFVQYAFSNGVDVSFSTSGIPITNRVAAHLNDQDFRTINISLDGWDESSYEAIRGSGRYRYFLRGLTNLRKHYNRDISAKTTLMTSNISHLAELISFATDHGFSSIKFNCVRNAGRASVSSHLIPSPEDYIRALRYLAERTNDGTGIKLVLPVNPYCDSGDAGGPIDDLGAGCYAGKESFCINPQGDIQPCSNFGPSLFIDGNVRNMKLKDAWDNGFNIRLFRSLQGATECATCPSYDGCRGGCYLRSYCETGQLDSLDPYCFEKSH